MRLRRAVPKIPAKSSVPPRLPFNNNHFLLTPSQSTLPQLLIPLHFNSFRSNVYKKPWGEGPRRQAQSLPASYPPHPAPAHARQLPQTQSPHALTSQFSGYPGGWGPCLLCVLCGLCIKIPIPPSRDFSPLVQTDPRHRVSFTTRHPLLTRSPSFQGKIYPNKSRSHHV